MASSSVAGLPSINAPGRSSAWWLRNHALPRTQAFFALVMWLFSTVSSISSQTQPQKVQVALATTFSSLALTITSPWEGRCVNHGRSFVPIGIDLGVAGDGRSPPRQRIDVDRVPRTFAQQLSAIPFKVLKQFSPFH